MSNPMMAAMEQLQLMQQKMAETQEALKTKTVTIDLSGGIITVTANGSGRITNVAIKPEAIDPNDREGLEDLVVTAVNKALDAADTMAQREMDAVTCGMMPDLSGLGLGM